MDAATKMILDGMREEAEARSGKVAQASPARDVAAAPAVAPSSSMTPLEAVQLSRDAVAAMAQTPEQMIAAGIGSLNSNPDRPRGLQ